MDFFAKLWEIVLTVLSSLPRQIYGIFYATSFLELYRNPNNATTTLHNITVFVNRDEQYLFLVRIRSLTYPALLPTPQHKQMHVGPDPQVAFLHL